MRTPRLMILGAVLLGTSSLFAATKQETGGNQISKRRRGDASAAASQASFPRSGSRFRRLRFAASHSGCR